MIQESRGPGYFMMNELEHQYSQLAGRRSTRRLWIASSDSAIDSAMHSVSDCLADLVLRVPDSHLMKAPVEGAPVLNVIDLAVDRFKLRGLVVCGHTPEVSRPRNPHLQQPVAAGFLSNKLLQGTHARIAQNQMRQSKILKYATSLKDTFLIAGKIEKNCLEMVTIFYLKESGVFSIFDESSGKFEAILGEVKL